MHKKIIFASSLFLMIGLLYIWFNQKSELQAVTTHPRIVLTASRLATMKTDPSFKASTAYTVAKASLDFEIANTIYGPGGSKNTAGTFLGDGSRTQSAADWLANAIIISEVETNPSTYDQLVDDMVDAYLTAPGYQEIQDQLASDPNYANTHQWWSGDFFTDASLIALSLAYDWKYADWDATTRQAIADKVATELSTHFETWGDIYTWPAFNPTGNHTTEAWSSMLVATYVAEDSNLYNPNWRSFIYAQLANLCDIKPDGSNHEGAGTYSKGTVEALALRSYLLSKLEGITPSCPFLTAYPDFQLANQFPGLTYQTNPGHNGSAGQPWRNANLRSVISSSFQMIDRTHSSPKAEYISRWGETNYNASIGGWYPDAFYLVLRDTSRPIATLSDFPTFSEFDDLGLVVYRENWSDDSPYLYFRCGNPAGYQTMLEYGTGLNHLAPPHAEAAHQDPDQCSFIFSYGDSPILMDTGYSARKVSQQHNLPIFPDSRYSDTYINSNFTYTANDKAGQFGSGNEWLIPVDGSQLSNWPPYGNINNLGEILAASNDADTLHIRGDATDIYYHTSSLKHVTKFIRGLLYDKALDSLIVADTVTLDTAGSGEYYWQIYNNPDQLSTNSWHIRFRDKDSSTYADLDATQSAEAFISFWSPSSLAVTEGKTPIQTASAQVGSYTLPTAQQNYHLKTTLNGSNQLLITLVTPSMPSDVVLNDNNNGTYTLSFTLNNTDVSYQITAADAQMVKQSDVTPPAAISDLNAQLQ